MKGLYYTAPSDESFEDMKKHALEIWASYDDEYKYATEKVNRIAPIRNIEDNFMYIFAMFDMDNQRILVSRIHPRTRKDLRERMVDGGNSGEMLALLGL